MEDEIINQDIIDFRYKLIDASCGDSYVVNGTFCSDGRNIMTAEKRQVLEDILVMFNIHFRMKNYDLG